MMSPDSLIQLVGSGNRSTVEDEWMRVFDAPDTPMDRLTEYHVVLSELVRVGRQAEADALGWAAIEAVNVRSAAEDALTVAGPILMALGDDSAMRAQVVALYRKAFGDRDGLDALLAESGLEGQRPVRRALRTLDVCLTVNEGDVLAERDHDGAARIEAIDRASWQFEITDGSERATLGAVHLADQYRPASPTEFRVMCVFDREQLNRRLWEEPASIVIDLCREPGDTLTSDALEQIVVPDLVSASDWKKWWTRARTALKRCPQIQIEGRSPYTLKHAASPVTLEDEFADAFQKERDPSSRYEIAEKYVRECQAAGSEPSVEMIAQWCDLMEDRAHRSVGRGRPDALLHWLIVARLRRLRGIEELPKEAVALLQGDVDVRSRFLPIQANALLHMACDTLQAARPVDWIEQLLGLLPTFPQSTCDEAVRRLLDAGCTETDLEAAVQQILASPVDHFDALLWLWDGPAEAARLRVPPPITLFARILRVLDDCRRGEAVGKDAARRISLRARAVLAARRYERFDACLQDMESGLAAALRRQLHSLDNLGRAVREDLTKRLERAFPPTVAAQKVQPWADEDVVYSTAAGLSRKRQEIDHHVNVKMRENARAIGEAASHGDLSENSEYKFALEERDLLRARLAQMNAEVAKARALVPEEVSTDHVDIGTRIRMKRVDGDEPYEMVILGPWDADSSTHTFNYGAPLAQRILGKTVGERVELDHAGVAGTFEIVEIRNVLLEDA